MISRVPQSAESWRGIFTFTRNFYDDFYAIHGDSLTWHLWSLSVEEQFYLIWPIVFLLGKRFRVAFLVAAILVSWGFRTDELLGKQSHFLFQSASTFNYLDCLAWGCLAAIFFERLKVVEARRPHAFVIFASLAVIPYLAQFGKGAQAIGLTGLMVQSVYCPGWGPYRFLNLKWVIRLGVLSYSIYIWQEAVVNFWPAALPWILWIPVAIGAGWISYKLLERPLLRFPRHRRLASQLFCHFGLHLIHYTNDQVALGVSEGQRILWIKKSKSSGLASSEYEFILIRLPALYLAGRPETRIKWCGRQPMRGLKISARIPNATSWRTAGRVD